MFRRLTRKILSPWVEQLPAQAAEERFRDRTGVPPDDPGLDPVIDGSMAWLARAQDQSASGDGGVARDFSLLRGWATSYPETTGYIIPTFIEYAKLSGDRGYRERARRMLDWMRRIQLPGGGYQGGKIDAVPVVPVTFNTGQILIGLAAGVQEFDDYRDAMRRAADWLVATQDPDGCWRRHPTPFAAPGEKAYETHVAWGLFEAARVDSDRGYAEAAMANLRWALTKQNRNGWLRDCCLDEPERPLTHTLGYALRGLMEAHRYAAERFLLDAARHLADGLLACLDSDGYLPGRLDSDWRPAVSWACLTGSVQIAHSWLLLHRVTGDERYCEAAYRANRYVRRTVQLSGNPDMRGGVKGSFPVDGDYGRYQFLNWAAKFCIDSNILEREVRAEMRAPALVERGSTHREHGEPRS